MKSRSLLDSVVADLAASRGTWPAIAAATGLHVNTLWRIANRKSGVQGHGIATLETLARYFREAA